MLFGQPILAIDNFREMLPRQESIVVSHRSSTEQDAHCTLGSEVASREMLVVAIRTRRSFLITRLGPITPSRLGDRVPTRDGWYSKVPRRCPASFSPAFTTPRYRQPRSLTRSPSSLNYPCLSRIVAHPSIPQLSRSSLNCRASSLDCRAFSLNDVAHSRTSRTSPIVPCSWFLVPGLHRSGSSVRFTCGPLK